MLLMVRHMTRYGYSQPVTLMPHTVRLKPASNANQRLVSFELAVTPEPSGRTEVVDVDGNESTALWFSGQTEALELRTEATVETLRENPFDYIWQGSSSLPMTYPAAFASGLAPYRGEGSEPSVAAFAREAAAHSNEAQAFLIRLARLVYETVEVEERETGPPREPGETLRLSSGACRDLAVLYMAAARQQGFAARFASGYAAIAGEYTEHDLHAWVEVYIPGGGWRGFDPSVGLAVSDRHILVATGARPEDAAAVTGSYVGNAQSELEAHVTISSR